MKKVIAILLVSLLWACLVNAQYPNRDTIHYNQFRDLVEWQREHWKNRIEKETNEQYQMIYIDRAIIDKKNKKIYLYSSYDLVSGDEHGIGINLNIKRKQKTHKKW
jgi:hypothetical protein